MLKAPAIVGVAVVFLFYFLKVTFTIGIIIICLSVGTNYALGELCKRYYNNTMNQKDLRKNKLSEALNSIKFLKLYSLTDSYIQKIEILRNLEMRTLRKSQILQTAMISLLYIFPQLLFASVFTWYYF